MPVQIGANTHTFSDPTGLLSDCHRRIEMFVRTLQEVGKAIDQSPTPEIRQSLEAALQYFAHAAPKHTADEEASLFPRVRQVDSPEVRGAFSQLDELEEDHRKAEALHAEIERLGAKYLVQGSLNHTELLGYRSAVADLLGIYARHIKIEDEVVFPLADKVLSPDQKATIAAEMASRRDVEISGTCSGAHPK